MLPAGCAEFLTTFVLPPAEFPGGGLSRGHALLPEYVRTAPGPDVKGVLAHILLRGPDGHLHLMQKAPANGRVSFLLTAVLTVTRTRRKRNWSPAPGKSSTSIPGLPATLNPRPASDPTRSR